MTLKIYVASSWKNDRQPAMVAALKAAGHEVYDFRHPHQTGPDRARMGRGFSWSEIDITPRPWPAHRIKQVLETGVAQDGYGSDWDAIDWCDALVMVQPCGVSSALELGLAVGWGKSTIVLLSDGEPELMLSMAGRLCLTVEEVVEQLAAIEEGA